MTYSIGQVADKTGLSAYTLRYYDHEGLMPFVQRTAAGRRRFTEHDLEMIELITCLKDTGMALKDIRHVVEVAQQGDQSLEQRLALFKAHRDRVDAQIAQLQTYRRKIDYKVRYFEAACEAGTEAAVEGNCHLPDMPIRINDALRVK
ncbi:MerR family transcriptional regulator [Levilactobacillus namurensis]|uniref:MerR family transcriptional regulator n=1 Tax=Levilactobacillus namurensis TaxID=380393 RepID=UPI0022325186|nr:MerR family transcriptional regulator [Levilactobacillus namurensis]MCW3778429.1 MerR family transcriptional regulator [Levilactobacillus namurensis]MDT7019785.1 MerR family transcriptional regulator [Levilactobacillus namurensis]WNN65628.1 MerR family transcriptional regulator [Levilactobacillus namurensis]